MRPRFGLSRSADAARVKARANHILRGQVALKRAGHAGKLTAWWE
jgi:hypothetical protein